MSDFSLDPDVINKYVAQKIVESSIGEALKTEIDKEVGRISSKFDNPMKPVVAQAIAAAAREYLDSPEVKARLKTVVEAALTDEALGEFIQKIVSEGYRQH